MSAAQLPSLAHSGGAAWFTLVSLPSREKLVGVARLPDVGCSYLGYCITDCWILRIFWNFSDTSEIEVSNMIPLAAVFRKCSYGVQHLAWCLWCLFRTEIGPKEETIESIEIGETKEIASIHAVHSSFLKITQDIKKDWVSIPPSPPYIGPT